MYIQQTLENVLVNEDGKQLLVSGGLGQLLVRTFKASHNLRLLASSYEAPYGYSTIFSSHQFDWLLLKFGFWHSLSKYPL